jgi:ubiquinone/menaquinone biosynthesis C-methylase UbiE
MLTKMVGPIVAASPGLRRALWKRWYQFLAGGYPRAEWTFMNYGFAELDSRTSEDLDLSVDDEADRYFIQLYHHVASAVDLRGLDVLEVGSGRGGGCSYIARYLQPRSLLGIDFSNEAVTLSRKLHAVPRLTFEQGDAEALPCQDRSFDAVINVESSHCYGSMERFLGEVFRVLRPGGHFLWADLVKSGREGAVLHERFQGAGLTMMHQEDITPNVLLALNRVSDHKRETIRRHVPRYLLAWFEDFAGVRGTRVYEALRTGQVQYWRCTLQKPATQ